MRLMEPHRAAAVELLWHDIKSDNIRIYFIPSSATLLYQAIINLSENGCAGNIAGFTFMPALKDMLYVNFKKKKYSSLIIFFRDCFWLSHVLAWTWHVATRAQFRRPGSNLILGWAGSLDLSYTNRKIESLLSFGRYSKYSEWFCIWWSNQKGRYWSVCFERSQSIISWRVD